jgi:hypothetical protein
LYTGVAYQTRTIPKMVKLFTDKHAIDHEGLPHLSGLNINHIIISLHKSERTMNT